MNPPWFEFHANDFALSFLSILFEGVPFLLFGTLVSGLIDAFIPAKVVEKFMPRNQLLSAMIGGLLGFIFPMCECGIVPVLRRLIKKGVPVHAAITYMLASPILNPITVVSTMAAFKGQDPLLMTSLRLGFGYIIAVGVGWALMNTNPASILNDRTLASLPRPGRIPLDVNILGQPGAATPASLRSRLVHAVHCSVSDFLDVVLYLIVGAALSAVFNTAIHQASINPFASNVFLGTAILMGLAVLLALCSTTDAFIAATFVSFPTASKLAFLVLGPMFDIKLFFMYSAVFRRGFVLRLAVALALATYGLSLMFHFKP